MTTELKKAINLIVIKLFITKEFKDCFYNLVKGYYDDLMQFDKHKSRIKKIKRKSIWKVKIWK